MATYISISRVFDELFDRLEASRLVAGGSRSGERTNTITTQAPSNHFGNIYHELPPFPASDIAVEPETGALHLSVALPGYDEADIEVSFENDMMLISICKDNALHKRKKERSESFLYLKEGLTASSLRCKIPIPFNKFKIKEAEAMYSNGMLEIKIPREDCYAPHKLTLSTGSDK